MTGCEGFQYYRLLGSTVHLIGNLVLTAQIAERVFAKATGHRGDAPSGSLGLPCVLICRQHGIGGRTQR
jgi:hypothetical protein